MGDASSSVDSQQLSRRALRRVFLTLFLRGRSARGLQKDSAPKSVGRKLWMTLGVYVLFGLLAFLFIFQSVFSLAIYLHAMTFIFLGMFVASSAGEVLFNKEEADILLHRPVDPRALLWAKIRVLVEVSLWLGLAFNLTGLVIGLWAKNASVLFPVAHVLSIALEAVFCTGCVVLMYQVCLRWFGRERLERFMTTAQVIVSVLAVLSGQLLPRVMFRLNQLGVSPDKSWWMLLLPPAWFAGIDDALAGSRSGVSCALAGIAVLATALVLWMAFGKLAHDYEVGLQKLGETSAAPARQVGKRNWIEILVRLPPLSWWLRDSVARASFQLTAAYLVRDRDVKLRIYPALAPFVIMPLLFLFQDHGSGSKAFMGLVSGYLGLVPLQALTILRYSQQWQAADIFHAAPIPGPAALCDGARRAVLVFLTLPMTAVFALILWFAYRDPAHLALMLPGLVLLPVMALLPSLRGKGVPLSQPPEEAKSAGHGAILVGAVTISMGVTGMAAVVWEMAREWFWGLLVVETVVTMLVYVAMRVWVRGVKWESLE